MELVMKFLSISKDGGAESTVWAYWLFEIKSLFSIVLLRFEDGSRDAYHSHAFDAVSWVLKGRLHEQMQEPFEHGYRVHTPGLFPVVTLRRHCHKVLSIGRTWVLSFRGPWADEWYEFRPQERRIVKLTHGRVELCQEHSIGTSNACPTVCPNRRRARALECLAVAKPLQHRKRGQRW